MATTLCEDCKASGMAILPARYAVVPKAVTPALPAWASADRVKSVPTGSEFHYALRTLRAGFVYLFYAKNAFGANQWETYAVTQDGLLVKQLTPAMAKPISSMSCSRQGHSDARLRHIVIQRPDKCGPTWIAFSEHAWSDETIKAYTDDSKLRNARMQTIHPSAMATGSKHNHGALADVNALEGVLEYASALDTAKLPYDSATGDFSKEDGRFEAARLSKVSTRTPWHLRKNQAVQDLSAMQERCKKPDGGENTPHVLALWDAIGITHELNGYRNDAAGWLKKYGDERELQITALSAIEGVKKALEKKVTDGWDHVAKNTAQMPDLQTSGLRNRAVMQNAKGDPATLGRPLYELDEKLRAGGITQAQHQAQRTQIFNQHSSNPAAMESAYKEIDAQRAHRETERNRNLANNKHNDAAQSWDRYAKKIDAQSMAHFKEAWDSLLAKADALIDGRTQTLVKWLEAPLLIDTLEDFHSANIRDGVLFEDVVGDAIFGIGSSKAGAAKIEAWVKEAKASVKGNLLWRAIALNQQEGVAEVDAALKVAYGAQVALTAQAWDKIGNEIKWNKVLDLTKKSLTAFNTQMKALNDSASGIKPMASMRGLEKIFATVGGQWVQPFKWTVDTANEVALRTLLMVRSGVDPVAAKALGAWDALHNSADRDMLLRRLKNQDGYLSAAAKAQYEEHAKKWAALRSNIEVPDAKRQSFNAARDARLALIVAVFEAFNLYKASVKAAKEPGSEKVQAQLTAAKLATAAAAIDVLSNMVKGLAAAGDRATSYQALKFGGAGLTVVASGYGAALDFGDFEKSRKAGDYRMSTLLFIRGVFQGTSGVLTSLTALSYCSPLIETFGKRFGERLAGKAITAVAARLLLARAALVFASLEVSIFLLFVSGVIWVFTDDALEKWCDRCAFGAKRKALPDAYTNAITQKKQFDEALLEVL